MADVNDVIAAYIKLRDERDSIKERHKGELRPVLDKMEKLENWLHRKLNNDGLKNFKGKAGTAFLKNRTSVTVKDREVFFDFVREQERWDLIDTRASSTAVQDFMEEHEAPPPGVDVRTEEVCQVRR